MYPQSPKASFAPTSGAAVVTTATTMAGNSNNGPPLGYERLSSYPGDNYSHGRPSKTCQTELTLSELNKRQVDLDTK